MAATLKIDFINDAYSQMRISGLTVNPTPEDVEVALMRLENMAYELSSRNICTGYNFEEEPDVNSLTNVDAFLNHMFATNLALRLIPDFNKEVPATLMMQASQSLSNASGRSAKARLQETQYPERMAIGSGNTLRYRPFNRFYRDNANPPNDCTTNVIYINDINDYQESFDSYLRDGETVSSFTIEADPALNIVSSSLTTPVVDYRIEALNTETQGNWQQVKIVSTTSLGRIQTKIINFDVRPSNVIAS